MAVREMGNFYYFYNGLNQAPVFDAVFLQNLKRQNTLNAGFDPETFGTRDWRSTTA